MNVCLKNSIDKNKLLLVFLITFVVASIIYAYSYNNFLPAYDAISIYEGTGGTATSGRWFIDLFFNKICKFFGFFYVIPQANLVAGYILIALSAYCIISVFDIENKIHIGIITTLYIASPAIADLVAWYYTFHAYCLSLFLASASVFLYLKEEKLILKYIFSFIFLVLSLAIYQAFLPVVTTILICKIILYVYDNKSNDFIIKKIFSYVLFLVLGVLLYIISCRISFLIIGNNVSGYANMSNNIVPQYDLKGLGMAFAKAFALPFSLVVRKFGSLNDTLLSKVSILIYLILLAFSLFAKMKSKDNIKRILLLLLYISLPISCCLFKLMDPDSAPHRITFSMILMFIVPLILFKDDFNKKIIKLCNIIIIIITMSILLNDMGASYNLYSGCKLIEHYTNQVATQIKSTQGYKSDMKVAMIGGKNLYDDTVFYGVNSDEMHHHSYIFSMFVEFHYKLQSYFNIFANYKYEEPEYLILKDESSVDNSKNVYYCLENDYKGYLHSTDKRIMDMPDYPNDGSIKIIDDVLVVKFSD